MGAIPLRAGELLCTTRYLPCGPGQLGTDALLRPHTQPTGSEPASKQNPQVHVTVQEVLA